MNTYQIIIKGHLNSNRARWFDGMTVTLLDNGDTLLIGPVQDQASLHAILTRIRDIGLTLLEVKQIG